MLDDEEAEDFGTKPSKNETEDRLVLRPPDGLEVLPKMTNSEQILEDLTLGEAAELAELLEQHKSRLLEMLARRIDPKLRARIDPEELLQDTFLIARKRYRGYDTTKMRPYPWLYRLALDAYLEAWKKHNRDGRNPAREAPLPEGSSAGLGLAVLETTGSPGRSVVREELQAMMRDALDQLDEDDRRILWMKHYDGLKHREIAEVLGLKPSAAAKRYDRALRALEKLVPDAFRPEGR